MRVIRIHWAGHYYENRLVCRDTLLRRRLWNVLLQGIIIRRLALFVVGITLVGVHSLSLEKTACLYPVPKS